MRNARYSCPCIIAAIRIQEDKRMKGLGCVGMAAINCTFSVSPQ